jgi:CDK inhibitor PHO81
VELLLKNGAQIVPDAEGLYPQHLVARSGHSPELLLLLKDFGADLDQVDKLYGWTPLVHAASEGNVAGLRTLLDVGANPNILDEKGLPALYYAAWEGHLESMALLTPYSRRKTVSPMAMQIAGGLAPMLSSSSAPAPMSLDADAIPVLELPPPIIPLRRYGHNFLDTKTVVQINFEDAAGEPPMIFFHDSKYPAARLTISSKASELIPKNIILPFQEDTRLVSFQVDNLDSFTLDFDVFPAYGAKVIAKTVALPSTFRALLSSSGRCCLPLFDPRLRAIGQISFHSQVIKPFQGKPLEITDFETYWKATSQFDRNLNTFVTGSSLSGNYVRLYVQQTRDGIPVLWPTWTIDSGGIGVPVSRLSLEQFRAVTSQSQSKGQLATISTAGPDGIAHIHRILATAGATLHEALSLLPTGMHVNLQILYTTPEEDKTLGLGPAPDINALVDGLLTVVFDHARAQRAQSADAVRSVVFSSYNPVLCTALNWKQPNFPVFLCNDLGALFPAATGAAAPQSPIRSSGQRTSSIKEVVRTAQSNNFMGLICNARLLVSLSHPHVRLSP